MKLWDVVRGLKNNCWRGITVDRRPAMLGRHEDSVETLMLKKVIPKENSVFARALPWLRFFEVLSGQIPVSAPLPGSTEFSPDLNK